MRRTHEIFSIFGQIEAVVAESMIERHEATKIERDMIPKEARFNDKGEEAMFAINMPAHKVAEFERRIAALYS